MPQHNQTDHSQHEQPEPNPPTHPASRRTVLRAAGLVALAGGGATVVSACAADRPAATPSSAAASPESAAASTPATETTPSESASATKSTTKPAETAPKGPSVATSKVPVGGGVILDDADYVVTQPTKGDFKAFSKICTHQKCPVTEVTGANIVCKCHGSTYSIKDGSVTNPPANDPLAESKVKVFGGKAYVTG